MDMAVKHVTISATPEDQKLIAKLKKTLAPVNGKLSTTALVRMALRSLEAK
jgi:hypothetical protein